VEDAPVSWRSRLKRWRWWIAAVALLLAVRVALPIVLRHVVASQASTALQARVEVGDVDLALWKGGVALDEVAVFEGGEDRGSAVGEQGPAAANDRPPTPDPQPPIIAFKRFAAELRYVPLFSKTIQLRDVALDSPRVALNRLASGDLNVMALVPRSEVAVEAGATPAAIGGGTAATPTAVADPAAAWKFGLDRFVLRDGRLRFRDLKLEGGEPVEIGIDEIAVREIALSPGVYGEPAQLKVKLGIEGGVIDVAAQLRMLEEGVAVTCDVNAQRLPMRHARLYVPKVGWSELKGELDLALTYALETGAKNEIRGTLGLRDVAVAVPNLEGDPVTWKSFGVEIETLDLLAQRVAVSNVTLDGARIIARAGGDDPFPVLGKLIEAPPEDAGPEPAPTPAAPEADAEAQPDAAAPEEAAQPWEWHVANVRVTDSTVHVLSDQPPMDVGIDLTAANLASAADAVAHVALGLGVGGASVKLDGDLRIAAPAFGGSIQIADLALPPLVAVSGAVEPSVLPAATLKADLAIAAGLPAKDGAAAAPDLVSVSGVVGISDARLSPPGQADLTVEAKSIELTISELAVPGAIPIGQKAAPGTTLRLAADLKLLEPRVTRTGDQPMDVGAQAIGLGVSELSLPAAMAGLSTSAAPEPIHAVARLELIEPRATIGADLSAQASGITLAVSEAAITAVPPGADALGASPARVVAQLDLSQPQVALAGGQQLNAGAQSIGLVVSELTLPGVTAGAPPVDTGQPLHAVAALKVAGARAVRGDGKEFSVAAKAVSVRADELAVPGMLAPAAADAEPLRAVLGELRIDAPALRITRTKDGIVLPAAAPAPGAVPAAPPPSDAAATAAQQPAARQPAPAAARPPEVKIAALRVTQGDVDFHDRAVQPAVQTRLKPIEIDARNVRFPDPSVKPLRIEITSEDQGRITASGAIDPQGGQLELVIDDFALTPFNSYATTYSPYSISEGALAIKTTVKYSGGKYDVTNALTLRQFDLGGAEGDSLFEEQFGIPLSLALALLRDASGDIDLNIPVQVDQSGGATVEVVSVVRSALRQALMGAVQSPLKLVGGVIGAGGAGSVAPAPIAFPLGRAEPTAAGAEGVQRLATFLTSRPGMAVQLDTAVTDDDVRWLHEQALGVEWQEEGFFSRSLGFLTQRGPRERIGAYLAARAAGEKSELSAEDAATLQRWLEERPAPSSDQLAALAAGRLTAVASVLRDKGIDAARVSRAEPSGEPAQGAPVVRIRFRPVGAVAQRTAPETDSEPDPERE
jgi:hypothetical protein